MNEAVIRNMKKEVGCVKLSELRIGRCFRDGKLKICNSVVTTTDKENGIVHTVRRREERRIRPGGRDAKGFRTAKEKRGAL